MTFEEFDKEFKETIKDEKERIRKNLNKSMLTIWSEIAWMALGRILVKNKLRISKR